MDYSVPLSPGQFSRLVADGRQHGWLGVLQKELDVSTAALRASRQELDAAQALATERNERKAAEGRTETVPPHKALRERANEMEVEIQDLRTEIQDLRTENRDLRASLDRAALRAELAPPQRHLARSAHPPRRRDHGRSLPIPHPVTSPVPTSLIVRSLLEADPRLSVLLSILSFPQRASAS